MLTTKRILVFFRRDVLLGVSLIGLALNLIGGLGPLITVARIAHYLVEHWIAVTAFVWVRLFGLFHIHIPPLFGFSLTMFLFHLGLVSAGLRWGDDSGANAGGDAETNDRERMIALLLYLPIMWGTLSTAFAALATHTGQAGEAGGGYWIAAAFVLVVGSPIVTFSLARPRTLIRRFVTVYVIALGVLALDMIARVLEATGLMKIFKDA